MSTAWERLLEALRAFVVANTPCKHKHEIVNVIDVERYYYNRGVTIITAKIYVKQCVHCGDLQRERIEFS